MKCNNLLVFLTLLLMTFFEEGFFVRRNSGVVEAKGKGKKCKIQLRKTGEYVVICPKKIANKERQRTVTRRRGPRGRKGEKGMPGIMGPVGPKGQQGNLGVDGPRGPVGPIGPVGLKGQFGKMGSQGIKGNSGEMGPTGSQGPPGMPGNCLADSPVYVQRNGVHCLPGPIGPQGRKGSVGQQGSKGPSGGKGEPGNFGRQGVKGARGPVGLPGLPGTLGKIACMMRFTSWINQDDLYQIGNIPVLCHGSEFMQGFVVEMARTDLRYRYYCCAFT